MEPVLFVVLSTAVGTIVGVACAAIMMRRGRAPVAETKVSPQNLAAVVAAPAVTIDDVRKLLAERDQTLQQCRDDLEKKHQQLEAANAAAESAVSGRAEYEQRIQDLTGHISELNGRLLAFAAKEDEGSAVIEQTGRQVIALTSQLDSEKRQNYELTEQIARLSSELGRYKSTGAEAVTQLEANLQVEKQQTRELSEEIARLNSELTGYRLVGSEATAQLREEVEVEKRHNQELAEQVAVLTIDLGQARQYGADADSYRSSLETELGVSRLAIAQLTDRVGELSGDREAEDRQRRELAEQVARLTSELASTRVAASNAIAQYEEQLDQDRKHLLELNAQATALTAELTQARQSAAAADGYRSSLETELVTCKLKIQELTEQVEGLTREKADFEVRLQEERQSAARGIELLTLAQSTLSGAFQRLNEEKQRLAAAAVLPTSPAPGLPKKEPETVRIESRVVEDPAAEPAETSMVVGA
ncbi:MAG TPA: hypothetical protein VMH81_10865 [Bryobacteraceae bacterium]|nr:hypothetical protein [Bryobacteraceae bacterium]